MMLLAEAIGRFVGACLKAAGPDIILIFREILHPTNTSEDSAPPRNLRDDLAKRLPPSDGTDNIR